MIRLEKGFVPKKLQELRERHKTSLNCNFEVVQDSKIINRFRVKSDATIYYVHIISTQNCDCLLKCTECALCFHEVSCTCIDFSINSVICKHIHYVAMKFKNAFLKNSKLLKFHFLDLPVLKKNCKKNLRPISKFYLINIMKIILKNY